jgi:myosin heavy subunit
MQSVGLDAAERASFFRAVMAVCYLGNVNAVADGEEGCAVAPGSAGAINRFAQLAQLDGHGVAATLRSRRIRAGAEAYDVPHTVAQVWGWVLF